MGEKECRSQGSIGLQGPGVGQLAFVVDEPGMSRLFPTGKWPKPSILPLLRAVQAGHDTESRQAEVLSDIVRCLEGVVQGLQQKDKAGAQEQTQNESQGQRSSPPRREATAGRFGCIGDADVAGAQTRCHARLLESLQQPFVELFVGAHLALQDAVLDGALVEFVHQHALAGDRGVELFVAVARELVVLAGRSQALALLGPQLLLQLGDLQTSLFDRWPFGPVAAREARQPAPGL